MKKVKAELREGSFFQLFLSAFSIVNGVLFGFMVYFDPEKEINFKLILSGLILIIVGLLLFYKSFIFSISENIKMANNLDEVSDVDIYDETGG